jgi:hypothetical protein
LRRPVLAGASLRIGTPFPSPVSVRIGVGIGVVAGTAEVVVSSAVALVAGGGGVGTGAGRASRNGPACRAIARFTCSRLSTDRPTPKTFSIVPRASAYGPSTHSCCSQSWSTYENGPSGSPRRASVGTRSCRCVSRVPYTCRSMLSSPKTDTYRRACVWSSRRSRRPSCPIVGPTSPVPTPATNAPSIARPAASNCSHSPRSTSWIGRPSTAAWRTNDAIRSNWSRPLRRACSCANIMVTSVAGEHRSGTAMFYPTGVFLFTHNAP